MISRARLNWGLRSIAAELLIVPFTAQYFLSFLFFAAILKLYFQKPLFLPTGAFSFLRNKIAEAEQE